MTEVKIEWLQEAYNRLQEIREPPYEEWPIPLIAGTLAIEETGIKLFLAIEKDWTRDHLTIAKIVPWIELAAAESNIVLAAVNKGIDQMASTYKERYPEPL